jgi:hypothetical protein
MYDAAATNQRRLVEGSEKYRLNRHRLDDFLHASEPRAAARHLLAAAVLRRASGQTRRFGCERPTKAAAP